MNFLQRALNQIISNWLRLLECLSVKFIIRLIGNQFRNCSETEVTKLMLGFIFPSLHNYDLFPIDWCTRKEKLQVFHLPVGNYKFVIVKTLVLFQIG